MATESDTVIPIIADRASKIDLVINCQTTNPKTKIIETKRYGVEITILAIHSVIFADMFTACDQVQKDREVDLTENGDVVLAFLKIIFGQDPGIWSFDLCVDVIEMAKKYQAKSVERHAYTQISCAFNKLASIYSGELAQHTRYGRLFILQFLLLWQSATNDGLSEALIFENSFKGEKSKIYYLLGEPYGNPGYFLNEIECRDCRPRRCLHFDLFDMKQSHLKELFNETELSFFTTSQLFELKLFIMLSITSNGGEFRLEYFMQDKFYKP